MYVCIYEYIFSSPTLCHSSSLFSFCPPLHIHHSLFIYKLCYFPLYVREPSLSFLFSPPLPIYLIFSRSSFHCILLCSFSYISSLFYSCYSVTFFLPSSPFSHLICITPIMFFSHIRSYLIPIYLSPSHLHLFPHLFFLLSFLPFLPPFLNFFSFATSPDTVLSIIISSLSSSQDELLSPCVLTSFYILL